MADNFDPNKQSAGFGDTIAKITHAIGVDKVAEGVARAMGREDCGCNRRRETLNRLFPYSNTPAPIPTPIDDSHYNYQGSRSFRVLTPLVIPNEQNSYTPGQIISIDTTNVLYPSLKALLENKTLEYIV